jgi:hypothetical protein
MATMRRIPSEQQDKQILAAFWSFNAVASAERNDFRG